MNVAVALRKKMAELVAARDEIQHRIDAFAAVVEMYDATEPIAAKTEKEVARGKDGRFPPGFWEQAFREAVVEIPAGSKPKTIWEKIREQRPKYVTTKDHKAFISAMDRARKGGWIPWIAARK